MTQYVTGVLWTATERHALSHDAARDLAAQMVGRRIEGSMPGVVEIAWVSEGSTTGAWQIRGRIKLDEPLDVVASGLGFSIRSVIAELEDA